MNKWTRRLIVVGVIFLAGYPIGYLLEVKSGAYAQAEKFVRVSPLARESFGEIQRVTLRWPGKFSESDLSGDAELSLAVQGSGRKGTANVTLTKANGIWSVSSAAIDGQIAKVVQDQGELAR